MGDVERLIKIEAIKGLSVYDICDLLDELDRVAKVHNLKMQSLESEIERLKKENEVLRIMDESYKLNWSNDKEIINKKDEEIERLREALKEISKYETCWTCKYYLGGTDKYCNPPKSCGVGRTQFFPKERSKILALEALSEVENEF